MDYAWRLNETPPAPPAHVSPDPAHHPLFTRFRPAVANWGGTSLRWHLVALVAAVALPLITMSAATLWSQFRIQRSQAEGLLLDQARGMARLLDSKLMRVEHVARTLAMSAAVTHGDIDAIQNEIASASALLMSDLPADAAPPEVIVTDRNGTPLLDSAAPPDRRYQSQAEIIDMIRAGHAGISGLQTPPDLARSFVVIVVPVHPAIGADRHVAAVLVLPPRGGFRMAITGAGIPKHAIASVHDQRGTIISRSLNDTEAVGHVPSPRLQQAIAQADAGLITEGARNLEGVPSVIAFARTPVSGYIFKLTVPESLFMAPLQRALIRTALIGLAVLVCGLALALLLERRILRAFRSALPTGPDVDLLTQPRTGLREADAIGGIVRAMLIERDATLSCLHQSTETTRILIERSPVGVVVATIAGHVISANEAFLAITGHTRTDLQDGAIRWAAIMPDEWQSLDQAAIAAAVTQGARKSHEKAYERPDGVTISVLLSFGMIDPARGHVAAFVVDLTRHKRDERALRDSEERYRALSSAAREGVAMHEKGVIIEANDAYWRMFGFDAREDIIGRNARDLIAPEALPDVLDKIRTRFPGAYESVGLRLDGTRFPAEFQGCTAQYQGRNVRISFVRDLTQQKASEAALRETEASFAALADSMPQLIWTAQPDGRNDYFNARYREFTGWSADALSNERWQNLLHPDDAPALAERWQHAVRTGEPFEAESRLRRHDGVYRWMPVRALPVHHSQAGTIRRWFDSCTDITDLVETREISVRGRAELEALVEERTQALQEAERRLAHSERMKALGQLAGGIAHDFNNVLQAVQGGGALIERRPDNVADVRRYATMILHAAERGASITHRLLAFSRRADLRAEPVGAEPLLIGLRDILTHTLGSGIEVQVAIAPDLPPLFADRSQLETVLVNLATNARDAMSGLGTLSFAATSVVCWAAQQPCRDLHLAPGHYIQLSVT
ncbi:MAG TPA: PAS domain S-box protein, partial [Rhodopila sp.]|nr:PAS domain S-box protein [Rhodopila sp.]